MATGSCFDLQSYLPHRDSFLLIDEVLEIIPYKMILAIKNLRENEPFFKGHFPNDPVMPGVLIVEAMAQAAHILTNYSVGADLPISEKYVLAAIHNIKFRHSVFPHDQLRLSAEMKWRRFGFVKYKVQATVFTQLVCEGEITVCKKKSSYKGK